MLASSPLLPLPAWELPMLQACVVTSRGCLPYPVSEDAAFPPDVPELWGEEQRGRVRAGHHQRWLGLGRPGPWAILGPGLEGSVWL